MSGIWKLFYKLDGDGGGAFAEIIDRDGDLSLRGGALFTHGSQQQIVSVSEAEAGLLSRGYEQKYEWRLDRASRDYAMFKQLVYEAISSDEACEESNALAIITDSSVMTISIALKRFDDLDSTPDDLLWCVDEWGAWGEGWNLDPAYRWLLAYGCNDQLNHEEFIVFQNSIRDCFVEILRSFQGSKDVLLIYIGGDSIGHYWSENLMPASLSKRMLAWL